MHALRRLASLNREDITAKRVLLAILRRIADIPHLIAWYSPVGFAKANRQRLKRLRNAHRGKRCFIVANGPSLKRVDFSKLKNEYTIGMNRIYLMKGVNGFMPNYLVSIDKECQLLQFTEEYDRTQVPSFYNWDLRGLFSKSDNQIFIKGRFSPAFSKDIAEERMGNGKSVTYACIQLAFHLGFEEVYLIGKDHSYNTDEKAGEGIESTGNEGNHFIKGYYKKGMRWDAPDYLSEEYAYKLAREAFEQEGRVIMDATPGGKLDVFEKVDFESLF